jgi:hypothetical protein
VTRAAAIGAAAAAWLALLATGFHVVPTASGDWRGISDPPDAARWLAALIAGGLVARLSARLPPGTATPLLFLGLAALPLVPVLAGGLPLLLLIQGPVLVLVAAAALAVGAQRALAGRGLAAVAASEPMLFGVAFAFFLGLGLYLPGAAGPQGDEPHYLVMTQSLLRDADLDLTNQFRERQYAEFFAGALEPHASPASPPGSIRSIHAPGLPALLLPAFAAFGYPGARALVSALAALTAVLAQRLVRESLGSRGLALGAWAVLTFTPPLPLFALAIYPEVPAALATVLFLLAARRSPSHGWLAATTVAAAALIWIHPKFLPLAALGLLLTLLRPCGRGARVGAAAAFLASLGLLLLFFERLYGAASLSAAYGPGFAGDVTLRHAPRGLLGLLVDRQFGLLPVAPLWSLAIPGAAGLFARRTGDGLRVSLLAAASVLVGASFSMWWGGSCPPARFVVPALPALALCLAVAIERRRELSAALFGVGLAVLALAAAAPRALHNRADGESALLRHLAPALDLDSSLPSYVVASGSGPLLTATAAGAAALLWLLGGRGLLAGAIGYAAIAGALRQRPLVDPQAAALELLSRWDETNLRGTPLQLGSLSVPIELPQAPWSFEPDEIRNARALDLPPGVYDVKIEGRVIEALRTARVVRLDLVAGELLLERRYLREDLALAPIELVLPAGARRLVLTGVGIQGKGLVERAAIVPQGVARRRDRDAFSWPRSPREDLYRLDSNGVRVTALDRVTEAAYDFLVESEARFVVEAAAGSTVQVRVTRASPDERDVLHWGTRRVPLGRATPSLLELPAADGLSLAGRRFVPARLEAHGSRITFSGSPGATSATESMKASPASLPSETSTSPPPDPGKK